MGKRAAVEIVLPEGSFGLSDDDGLSDALWKLTEKVEKRGLAPAAHGLLGGNYGYGADFENDVFLLHPYCWCDGDDCPWCCACDCPDSAFGYTVDGKGVSYDEWMAFFDSLVSGLGHDDGAWDAAATEANRRRGQWHKPECAFCVNGGVAKAKGGLPGQHAPNFWHKPSGYQVRWYKYVGRDMEEEDPNRFGWRKALDEAFASLA